MKGRTSSQLIMCTDVPDCFQHSSAESTERFFVPVLPLHLLSRAPYTIGTISQAAEGFLGPRWSAHAYAALGEALGKHRISPAAGFSSCILHTLRVREYRHAHGNERLPSENGRNRNRCPAKSHICTRHDVGGTNCAEFTVQHDRRMIVVLFYTTIILNPRAPTLKAYSFRAS